MSTLLVRVKPGRVLAHRVSHVGIGAFVKFGYMTWIACGELDPLTVALGELVFEPCA